MVVCTVDGVFGVEKVGGPSRRFVSVVGTSMERLFGCCGHGVCVCVCARFC